MKGISKKAAKQIKRIALGIFFIGLFSQVLTAPKSDSEKNYDKRPALPKTEFEVGVELDGIASEEASSSLINLSTCSEKELMSLPGIGKKLARRIIEFRNEYGFQRIEDLMFVPGIGSVKYERVKSLIRVK